jgi:membrane protein
MAPSPRPVLRAIDDFQKRHRALAFPIAVWRKFSDDQAGNLAALISYYAFLSVFPLLLLLVTVLGILLRGDPALQQKVLSSALSEFPVIGQQLHTNVHSLNRTGVGLIVGILGTLFGARSLSGALQNAMNTVWEIPRFERPNFLYAQLRDFAIIGVIGLGIAATTLLSGLGSVGGGIAGRVLAIAAALVVNVGLFLLGLRVATAGPVTVRDLWLGALLAAIVWQVLQSFGLYFVTHSLRHASSLYGVFGLVLGLLAWFYLQARLTLFAVEADVVRARGLWPRSVFPPPFTEEDREAYEHYANANRRSVHEKTPTVRMTHEQGGSGRAQERRDPEQKPAKPADGDPGSGEGS